jgi:hypothetical protein
MPGLSSGDGASPTKKIGRVRSSTPVPCLGTDAEAERHLTFNQDEVGSIPTGSTKETSDGDHR